ncbi:MAG: enoyl-CoA hydratase-related protein [Acidimicrobiales bacterium]
MAFTTLSYDVRDGVGHVRFTRPEGANAVNPALARDLRDVVIEIQFDDAVKAVSVTAEGKVFCAGGDLKEFNDAGDGLPTMASQMLVDFHAAINRMNRTPKPFVAGVGGAAGGAGMSLMSAFDLVVSPRRRSSPWRTPGRSHPRRHVDLFHLPPHRRAADARPHAHQPSVVGGRGRVVGSGQPSRGARRGRRADRALAQQLADGASWALGMAKRIVYEGHDTSLEKAGELEAAVITESMGRHDGREGIAAFVEKRAANFTGQ